jgi:NADP-dependent 3-hydroxy acid dehydrogenase YdfG
LAGRFAAGGYRVAMLARNAERLQTLEGAIDGTKGYPCDVADRAALEAVLAAVRRDLGAPRVVVHNAVGGAFGDFMATTPETLRQNFEINTIGLLHLAQLTVPDMVVAGDGVLLCTGNTSAHRGVANFSGFAPTKAAQRILAESIARAAGPQGVHVAYVTIDAVIDLAWTRAMFADKPDEFFIQPAAIAGECFHVAHQPRSAWAFNVEIRPYGEKW